MFDYKDASFFDAYFSSLEGFKLIEKFHESDEEYDKGLFVGSVEVLGTIHPLVLRVEIPKTFPHMGLTFKTKSLSGYPHLIHTGNTRNGDWFCLNTPFAETADEQLSLEITRLKEWISRQMREDLPPHIKDPDVIKALRYANAYDWENTDEMNEFSSKANLTFVGDFQSDPATFKNDIGYFHCIKTIDHRYYAFKDKSGTNFDLPYIILHECPESLDDFGDIVKLIERYSWDDKICAHLLPGFDFSREWKYSQRQIFRLKRYEYAEEEASKIIQDLLDELNKDDSYLICSKGYDCEDAVKRKVLAGHKKLLVDKLEKLQNDVAKNHCYENHNTLFEQLNISLEEQLNEQQAEEPYYEWHSFAIGVKEGESITWRLIFTNYAAIQSEIYNYDLGLCSVAIDRLISHPCNYSIAQNVNFNMFFGRGQLSKSLCGKRVAIVGLGAIGSKLAESLARGGVCKFGLWDSDIVEPGNICRSSYRNDDLGESKVLAIEKMIRTVNPFASVINYTGHWLWRYDNINEPTFVNGSFYGEVNYSDQQKATEIIRDYDLIFDCTGSNEMLHFLSYAVPEITVVSLCITNHASNLLCITSNDGNPFELRKAYLSRIEQDTKNFYMEGSGCYSPTFLARNCDIDALVNLTLRDIDNSLTLNEKVKSTIWSYGSRGVISDRLQRYRLDGFEICMTISSETIMDGEELSDDPNGQIGYVLGAYSRDGGTIIVTHMIGNSGAESLLSDAYHTSCGIIDYIGDIRYSMESPNSYSEETFAIMREKAENGSINTLNPLLALRNPNGTFSFFLYIDSRLVPFVKE